MRFDIRTIPHNRQRYPTLGDYYKNEKGYQYRVSNVGNEDYEFLIGIHELIESYLCLKRGIPWSKIDAFDKQFEQNRASYDNSEPGDSPDSPYGKEHIFAENIERLVAQEFGISWLKYSTDLAKLLLKGSK